MSDQEDVFSKESELQHYYDENHFFFVHRDFSQTLVFPDEYPAFIQVHMEHPAQEVPVHWHPDPEVIYSRNKELAVTINGKTSIVSPGGFILISSYALHAIRPSASDEIQDVLSVTFKQSYLEHMIPEMTRTEISAFAPKATDESRRRMTNLLESLRANLDRSGEFLKTNADIFAILDLMYHDFSVGPQHEKPQQAKARNQLTEVLAYINTHYRDPLTTQGVADYFGYTRTYFCRLFKRYDNQTFKEYLTHIRLRCATEELKKTNRNIREIAIDHGFPDEKSFFAAFRREYGMTPSKLRKKIENEEI